MVTRQELEAAKIDVKHAGEAVNAKKVITPRYGNSFKSIPLLAEELQQILNNKDLEASQKLQALQGAINVALAAGAGAAGWTDKLIAMSSGGTLDQFAENQKTVSEKVRRENVSVWDFFTSSEYMTYKATPTIFDAYRPIQAFFDYIAANDVGTAYCNGSFFVSKGLLLGGISGSKTKNVIGDATISALPGSTINTLFQIQAGDNFSWFGLVYVRGIGGLIYANRTIRRGLVIGGEYPSTHTYIASAYADNGFLEYGVLIDNKTTGSCIDSIRTTRCGSGMYSSSNSGGKNWSLWSNFTVDSENIASGYDQRTVLKVTSLPLTDLQYRPLIIIGGELYHVDSVDRNASTISIFPLLNRENTATEFRYVFGAGVATAGSDASVIRINKMNSTGNAVSYHSGALYPATVGALTAEANCINILIGGNSLTQAHVGGFISSLYCESSEFDIVRRTSASLSMVISSTISEIMLDKFYDLTRTRNSATNVLGGGYAFQGIQMNWRGNPILYENPSAAGNNVASIDVGDKNRTEYWHYGNTRTFTIAIPNTALNKAVGYNRKSCVVVGTGNNGNPTGDIVFNAPSGYTVNGGSSAIFNGFTQAAKFDVYLQYVRNNFIIVCSTLPPMSALSASVTYDPPPLAPSQIEYWNVTLTGAKLGDMIACSFDKALSGTRIWAEVTSANLVTVYHHNPTASTVDLSVGILKVKLL